MDAKQKAKELVIKKFGCSKGYALKAVDEIINSIVITDLTTAENQFIYWEEVKQEIEKL